MMTQENGNALDLLTQHFERLRGQKFEVPGIRDASGNPLVIYYDPPTNADAAMIRRRSGGGKDEAKLALYTVIYLAKGADGKRLFADDAATVQALSERVSGAHLNTMASAIMRVSTADELGN